MIKPRLTTFRMQANIVTRGFEESMNPLQPVSVVSPGQTGIVHEGPDSPEDNDGRRAVGPLRRRRPRRSRRDPDEPVARKRLRLRAGLAAPGGRGAPRRRRSPWLRWIGLSPIADEPEGDGAFHPYPRC